MGTTDKRESQYARSLIEASLDPLFTINTGGKITDINNAAVEMTGVTREDLIGTDFFEYFTEPEKAREIYRHVFAEGFVADFPLTISDGKLTEVLFNGSVYKDEYGNVIGVVVVARDISDHKRIEKELKDARTFAESAAKFAEDAKEIAEKATKIAEDAVKSKQQFLSNMSHEIRTPMNAIIGFTKVLLKSDLDSKQREYLNAIKMSGDALTVLINDILDLAKVDAGKMSFEQTIFKPAASISAMIHLFEIKIREKNLKLIKEYDNKIPGVLIGDPVRLHQIISNLVSNAVKFTSTGEITISAELLNEDEENATIEFSVSDTGIGIAEDKLEHIFENFQQATSETARLYGGTGLGLAISKQLVESQGGSINVKSQPEAGSVFSFILPFRKTNAGIELQKVMNILTSRVHKAKVLVVEDIALNQLLMKTLLDDFGFENDIAGNGRIAIEKLQKKTYDIILMDLHMPEMNGFEATQYIRGKMKSRIPIIALTADVTTADLNKCSAVGMNDYISKPLDEKLLYNKMIELLRDPVSDTLAPAEIPEYVDLTSLKNRTKGNRDLMLEMIGLFIEQTPLLIKQMKQGINDRDWDSIYSAAHKLIPSFSIMGMHEDFEIMARKIQEYSSVREHLDEVNDMVMKIDDICTRACEVLKRELNI